MDFLTLPKKQSNRIDLNKVPLNLYLGGKLSNASFAENFISFEDDSIALLKIPLSSAPKYSGVYPHGMINIQPDEYNPLLAKEIANVANIPCAEYYLASYSNTNYILTPSFLDKDDELILGSSLVTVDEFDINNIIKELKSSLTMRRFNSDEITTIQNNFIKQCFISKFIGNIDEQNRNFGIILNNRHIKLAPFFDLDYSFEISKGLGYDRHINGDTSLNALIENFKDSPGFMQFVKTFLQRINVPNLFSSVESSTGIQTDNFLKNKYTDFINKQIDTCKKTVYTIEKGEFELS